MNEDLADALAPLIAFIADNMDLIERCADAYTDWGTGWLEALANGYIAEDWQEIV